jgi:hypothetical protein
MKAGIRATACLLILLTNVAGGPPADEIRRRVPLPGLISDVQRFHCPSNHARLEVLKSLLTEWKLKFEVRHFAHERDGGESLHEGDNVVLTFGSGDRVLVVGAHFDAATLPDGRVGPGAVDNAAGVVVLVRVADAIRKRRINNRVHVVFFDGEESGLAGSEQFARSLEADRVEAMINVDIVGYGDTVIFGPTTGDEEDRLARALRSVCSRLSSDCFATADEAHQVWLMFNKPEQSGLREDFTPSVARLVHTSDDTADKLDPATMTMAYNLIESLLLELDRQLGHGGL